MKHQRWVALLAAAGTVALAGCSSSSNSSNAGAQSSPATQASAPASNSGGGASASAPASAASLDVSAPTTITVNCEPPTTQAAQRKNWTDDVAAFEKLHPNITIVSKDENPCDDPNTFSAKLASGQQENVFYLYMTDAQQAISSGQVLDLQQYASQIPQLADLQSNVVDIFRKGGTDSGDLYGLPKADYTLGLLYNRTLFQKAGLDPSSPPTTWADVVTDAKKIAAIGDNLAHGVDQLGPATIIKADIDRDSRVIFGQFHHLADGILNVARQTSQAAKVTQAHPLAVKPLQI